MVMMLADVVPHVGEKVYYLLVIFVQRGAPSVLGSSACDSHKLFCSDKFKDHLWLRA